MMSSSPPAEPATPPAPPVVVKKYANRRLYNTESSSYITLENLADMVRAGRDFVVFDAKSGDDITRGVLTQIIVEEESKGRALLPTAFLRQLIGFYGDSMQGLVPRYLENAMAAFSRQQDQLRDNMQKTVGNLFPGIEEVGRQNMAMVERAMSLFAPFYRAAWSDEMQAPSSSPDDKIASEVAQLKAEIDSLKIRLEKVQAQSTKTTADPEERDTLPNQDHK
jgi:polyhydroxyalkanoate synthesis repressor PhaR